MWAILAAPFLLSNDLRTIKPEIKELILNREIIKVDQDPLGIQGKRVNSGNGIEVWSKPIGPIINGHHSYAIAIVSRRTDGHPHGFNITLKELALDYENGYIVKVKLFKSYIFLFTHNKYLMFAVLTFRISLKTTRKHIVSFSQMFSRNE